MLLTQQLLEFKVNKRTNQLVDQVKWLSAILNQITLKTSIPKPISGSDIPSIVQSLSNEKQQEYAKLFGHFIHNTSDIYDISSLGSSSIDLDLTTSHNIDISVALLDRSEEMKQLITINSKLFTKIKSAIFQNKEAEWNNFCKVLTLPRSIMTDREWMSKIVYCFENQPALLSSLKQLVGYGMYQRNKTFIEIINDDR